MDNIRSFPAGCCVNLDHNNIDILRKMQSNTNYKIVEFFWFPVHCHSF